MKYKYRYVDQAKQILGQETGAVQKDWGGKVPVALVYPNVYRLGMGSLAIHTLYRIFNDRVDFVCERAFWGLLSTPRADEPVISLESRRPLDDFAIVAFSLSYEMDYLNVINVLRRAGIPLLASERDDSWPLIIAGGPAIYTNPAPLSDLLDAVLIGEAEAVVPQMFDGLKDACYTQRRDGLEMLANLPGVYVPSVSQQPVERVWFRHLDSHPASTQIYSPDVEFGDRGLIEIGRGCVRGCRFCMAGAACRPARHVKLETIVAYAQPMLAYRDKLGLVSAAVSDHPQIDEIALTLRSMGARLAISSMRTDPISEPLIQALAESGTQTLTIAPEAGSSRLREKINKPQSEEHILNAVSLAARYDFTQLKMYFMIGHPTEEEADVEAIADLTLAARERFPRNLTITVAPYVPKAQTAFQWSAMAAVEILEDRIKYLQKKLQPAGVVVRADSPAWAVVEGVLARGDRRIGRVLTRMRRMNLRDWRRALEAESLSEQEYLRQRALEETLPWQVVNMGLSQRYLRNEMLKAGIESITA